MTDLKFEKVAHPASQWGDLEVLTVPGERLAPMTFWKLRGDTPKVYMAENTYLGLSKTRLLYEAQLHVRAAAWGLNLFPKEFWAAYQSGYPAWYEQDPSYPVSESGALWQAIEDLIAADPKSQGAFDRFTEAYELLARLEALCEQARSGLELAAGRMIA